MNSVITFFILLALSNLQYLILGSNAETSDNIIFNRNGAHRNEINDDIRCYCNLPRCVSQNFMCQTNSKSGGCFAERRIAHEEETPPSDLGNHHLVHGCIELESQKNKCNKNKFDKTSSFICCHGNLCNILDIHKMDSIDSNQLINSTNDSKTTLDQNKDWCMLATIIVPIIGAVIIFSLVAISIRIVRSNRSGTSGSSKSCSTDYEKNHFIRNQIIIDNSLVPNSTVKDKNEYNLLKNNCNRLHRKIDKTSTKSTNTQTIENYEKCNNINSN